MQQLIHKPHVVTVEWVVQSLRLKRAAPESAYTHPEFKVIVGRDTENVTKKTVNEQTNNNNQDDSHMVQQYLTTDHFEEEETGSLANPSTGLFSGLKFQLVGLERDSSSTISEIIVSQGGRIVAKKPDYAVAEPVGQIELSEHLESTDVNVVNTLWIEDCIDHERLLEVEAYHRPIKVADSRRLDGCVISFSGIQGRLRELLDLLINYMKGMPQEIFSRKSMEEKNVYRSTHLVCAKPEGKKYEKALEWGVHAVHPDWVIACAMSTTFPKEIEYPATGEPLKQPEIFSERKGSKRSVEQPAESIVLKSTKLCANQTPTNSLTRRLPAHFDISTPQTPAVISV